MTLEVDTDWDENVSPSIVALTKQFLLKKKKKKYGRCVGIFHKSNQRIVILLFNMSDEVDALLSEDKDQVDVYISR